MFTIVLIAGLLLMVAYCCDRAFVVTHLEAAIKDFDQKISPEIAKLDSTVKDKFKTALADLRKAL